MGTIAELKALRVIADCIEQNNFPLWAARIREACTALDSLAQQAVPVAANSTCPYCNAPCLKTTWERGGDHGWGDDSTRVRYIYSAPTAAVEVTDGMESGYYIASFRSGPKGYALWWGPNNAGYTTDIATAGIYPDYQRGYHDANDNVPVPVAFVRALRARTMIDIGDTGNGCLWNEANLRAALVAALGAGKS